MSHRTHHGHLIGLHTERVFPEPAFWALLTLAAVCLAITQTGCATTSVQCTSLAKGACTVSSSRLITDSAVALTTPDGTRLEFTSKPDQPGISAAFGALGGVIDLLGKLLVAKPASPQALFPTDPPLAPSHPGVPDV